MLNLSDAWSSSALTTSRVDDEQRWSPRASRCVQVRPGPKMSIGSISTLELNWGSHASTHFQAGDSDGRAGGGASSATWTWREETIREYYVV